MKYEVQVFIFPPCSTREISENSTNRSYPLYGRNVCISEVQRDALFLPEKATETQETVCSGDSRRSRLAYDQKATDTIEGLSGPWGHSSSNHHQWCTWRLKVGNKLDHLASIT